MLSAQYRMVSGDEFAVTIRNGVRKGNRAVVVHVLLGSQGEGERTKHVGFVVGKRQIPKAVNRNKVKRRLRHLMRERITQIPENASVVVRALAPTVSLSFSELAVQLDRALQSALQSALRSALTGVSQGVPQDALRDTPQGTAQTVLGYSQRR